MAGWTQTWQRRMSAIARRAVKQAVKNAAKKTVKKPVKQAVKKTVGQTIKKVLKRPAAARPSAAAGAGEGAWLPGVTVGLGGARAYRLYRPPGLTPSERLPLLVMLHGCSQSASGFAASTRMNQLADRERCCVLYPEQDRRANAQGCWQWFESASGRAEVEMALLMNAIEQVCLRHPIDAERVAIAGLSAGASMAALLARKHPTRFQAVVMHSGIAPGLAKTRSTALSAMQGRRRSPDWDSSARLPPLMVIQGAADLLVVPRNGQVAAQLWADAGGAAPRAARTLQRGKRYPMTVTDYLLGQRVRVSLVEIAQLGHAWSGGAAAQAFSDAKGPDASRLLWAFVVRQFKAIGRQRKDVGVKDANAFAALATR